MMKAGVRIRKELISPARFPLIREDLVWLRFDVRSPADLDWIVKTARKLEKNGASLFPSSESLRKAEYKWETWRSFEKK